MTTAILDKIPKVEFAGLKISDAAKGLVAAGLGDAASLIILRYAGTGRTANELRMLAVGSRLGAAWLLQMKQVKGALGSEAANIGSLLLVADAIRSIWDVRNRVGFEVAKLLPLGNAGSPVAPNAVSSGIGTGGEVNWG